MHMSYVFDILMKENSVQNVVQAYLSGMFAHKAILSDSSTELKYAVLTNTCKQLGIKRLYSNLIHPQQISKIENVCNFL